MKLKKRQLKLLFIITLCVFAYMTWTMKAQSSVEAQSLGNDDFIRFHVIANSDTKEDQALKLKVRDGLLAMINEDMAQKALEKGQLTVCQDGEAAIQERTAVLNIKSARHYIQENIPKIEAEARRIIVENGYDYDVKVNLGVRWIPEKTYGNLTFPPGNYEALNVAIGQGGGQNWWCVLFPPLCLIDADSPRSAAEVYMDEDAAKLFAQGGINLDGIYGQALLDHKYADLMEAAKENQPHTTLKLKFKSAELLEKLTSEK